MGVGFEHSPGYDANMLSAEQSAAVRRIALATGFDRVGIARAERLDQAGYLRTWLDQGSAGQMDYLQQHFEPRVDPRVLLPGARSVVVVALNYNQSQPVPPSAGDDAAAAPRGRVAMYAWGNDYHKVVKKRLHRVVDLLRQELDVPFEARSCVDTAPVLERQWAARAGIGWIGKNTMTIHPELGSYFFLGEIITTLELVPDEPITDHCGSCRRCLEACPTQAFPEPYRMDATRCISYWTIEHRGDIPEHLQAGMGDWVFGCDVCQQVCPFNGKAPTTDAFQTRPPGPFPKLAELMQWTQDDYARQLQGSAMKRAKLPMLQRNAAIALANHARR
jgi:epoxyqueuosine reductase